MPKKKNYQRRQSVGDLRDVESLGKGFLGKFEVIRNGRKENHVGPARGWVLKYVVSKERGGSGNSVQYMGIALVFASDHHQVVKSGR